jgi:hypothetical protein
VGNICPAGHERVKTLGGIDADTCTILTIGGEPIFGKRPHELLRVGSRAARKRVIGGIPNSLSYCVNFCSTYIIYKGDRRLHYANWRTANWKNIL